MRFLASMLVAVATTWLWASDGLAQSPEETAALAATKRFQAHAKEIATAHELHAGNENGRQLVLIAEPVLRWANPLGGKRAHGEVFLWIDNGHPAAVLSTNEFTDATGALQEEREWHSLATGPLTAVGPDGWAP